MKWSLHLQQENELVPQMSSWEVRSYTFGNIVSFTVYNDSFSPNEDCVSVFALPRWERSFFWMWGDSFMPTVRGLQPSNTKDHMLHMHSVISNFIHQKKNIQHINCCWIKKSHKTYFRRQLINCCGQRQFWGRTLEIWLCQSIMMKWLLWSDKRTCSLYN